jgi:hypothetical protein
MINKVIDGVKFQNLPAFLDEKGKISYPLNSWAVADLIASKIEQIVKPYVTVDFTNVDMKPFLLELNNGETYDAEDDPEQKILEYIFGQNRDKAHA